MNNQKPSLTIIMPAFNEAPRIRAAYETATRAVAKAEILDYEILMTISISPDGSHDGTPDIARQISMEDSHVKFLNDNPGFRGMGFRFKEGFVAAQKDYVIMVPGANHTSEETLVNIFSHIGEAPLILTYTKNPKVRPFYVRLVSRSFVLLCNILFGLDLKYFNGICLYPRKLLQLVPMSSESPAYNAEILIYLVKSGVSYMELTQEINSKSSAVPGRTFMFGSAVGSLKTLAALFWKIHFQRKRVPVEKI